MVSTSPVFSSQNTLLPFANYVRSTAVCCSERDLLSVVHQQFYSCETHACGALLGGAYTSIEVQGLDIQFVIFLIIPDADITSECTHLGTLFRQPPRGVVETP